MRTNLIPIIESPPVLTQENIDFTLERVAHFHPDLELAGHQRYLCDLLSVKEISDITGEDLFFQNIEPAVSREELHHLAERVLGYHGNNKADAIFAVRNILNTIPKTLDDLIDYTTEERLAEFIHDAAVYASAHVGCIETQDLATTLEAVEEQFLDIPEIFINLFGNMQMDSSRELTESDIPAITERQRYLYRACDYYLNHRVGFRTNTMWLAGFINSQVFGCDQGWLHHDGSLCHERHFGFKDDDAVVKLVLLSEEYVQGYLENLEDISPEDSGYSTTATMHIDTMLYALEILVKQRMLGNSDKGQYQRITNLLEQHIDYMSLEQILMMVTLRVVQFDEIGFTEEQFSLLQKVVNQDYSNSAPKSMVLHFFDAWNFMIFGVEHIDDHTFGALFIKARYDGAAFREFASILISQLKETELTPHWHKMCTGFFTNYLHNLTVSNSDNFFLFDDILEVCKQASSLVENQFIVKTMAALGHEASAGYLQEAF
jgi:hypothetical protein